MSSQGIVNLAMPWDDRPIRMPSDFLLDGAVMPNFSVSSPMLHVQPVTQADLAP
jgi:hypothetical protein